MVIYPNSVDFTPVVIGYNNDTLGRKLDDPPIRQTVTFESCVFFNMRFGQNTVVNNDDDTPNAAENYTDITTLFMATHPANTLIIRDCVFRENGITNGAPVRVFRLFG